MRGEDAGCGRGDGALVPLPRREGAFPTHRPRGALRASAPRMASLPPEHLPGRPAHVCVSWSRRPPSWAPCP